MKSALLVAATLAALSMSSNVQGADVSARDPHGILTALGALGYQAELKTGTDGFSRISMTIDGSPSSMLFYGCDDEKANCETLLLAYGMDLTDGVAVEKVNEWNLNTVHGFVYSDEEADPWLNMAVFTGSGISEEVFGEVMRLWRQRIGAVRDFFDF